MPFKHNSASRCRKPTSHTRWVARLAATACFLGPAPLAAQEIAISYSIDITSNYLAKGFTQTEDRPAIQPYIEFAYGSVYLSLFASNARFGGVNDTEYDVGVGVRPSVGKLDLDIGFVQYFYRVDKADYGEAYVYANYDFSDDGHVGLKVWHEVYADYTTVYLHGGIGGLPWDMVLSGGVGSDFGSRDLSEDAVYADIGLTKGITDFAAIDLRAIHSAIEGGRILATLSFFF
ncbi:TorF family putative porin [Falsiphaeobacter marinintestinus]|uniref:TorF family putative porin n=1 Tax=Falsiphaeobacter marinintestinus TaxID=1492905 RepID=UPI0016497754|nr:TorF family putative porin [Phaeobacter marinintestinus]